MDNKHRWDELLAEINGQESPAWQREQEIDRLEKEQNDDYIQTVVAEFSDQLDADGRVFTEEALRRAFADYPNDPGELIDQITELHREIANQQLVPDTIVLSPATAAMIMNTPAYQYYDEYSYVNTPADSRATVSSSGVPNEVALPNWSLRGQPVAVPTFSVEDVRPWRPARDRGDLPEPDRQDDGAISTGTIHLQETGITNEDF